MYYCSRCHQPTEALTCPRCGAKKLPAIQPNDPVYLLTKDGFWAGAIEGILKENGIPCLMQGHRGAYMAAYFGSAAEVYRFLVPYSAYDRARELVSDFLAPDTDEV